MEAEVVGSKSVLSLAGMCLYCRAPHCPKQSYQE